MLFKSTFFSALVLSFFLALVSAVPTKIVERTTSPATTSNTVCKSYTCPTLHYFGFTFAPLSSTSSSSVLTCKYQTQDWLKINFFCLYWTSGSNAGGCNTASSHTNCLNSSPTCNTKRDIAEDTETDMQRRIRKRQWSSAKAQEVAARRK